MISKARFEDVKHIDLSEWTFTGAAQHVSKDVLRDISKTIRHVFNGKDVLAHITEGNNVVVDIPIGKDDSYTPSVVLPIDRIMVTLLNWSENEDDAAYIERMASILEKTASMLREPK